MKEKGGGYGGVQNDGSHIRLPYGETRVYRTSISANRRTPGSSTFPPRTSVTFPRSDSADEPENSADGEILPKHVFRVRLRRNTTASRMQHKPQTYMQFPQPSPASRAINLSYRKLYYPTAQDYYRREGCDMETTPRCNGDITTLRGIVDITTPSCNVANTTISRIARM